MDQASRKTLELFIEKTEHLVKYVLENNYGGLMGVFRTIGDKEWQFHKGIEGFLLAFRMFIQSKDEIALYDSRQNSQGQLNRPKLLDLPGMSDSWHGKVEQAYKWVVDALAIAPPNLIYNGKPITRWEILETFLYGYFAHTTQRERFNLWRDVPDLFGNLQFEFVGILGFMLGQIVAVAEASKHELSLDSSSGSI